MKVYLFFICFLLLKISVCAGEILNDPNQDSTEVKRINKSALDIVVTNPAQTVSQANKALLLAQKINFVSGIGEANRVMGIGYYHLNQPAKALNNYWNARLVFVKINDLSSQAKVYNNIGNLYIDNDYDQSLEFFQKCLTIATTIKNNQLIGSCYLNMGNVYYRKESYQQALDFYNKSYALLVKSKDSLNMMRCLQNKGVIYFNLNQLDKADELLTEAHAQAKNKDWNESVASIDLALASLYTTQNKYDKAEQIVAEGLNYSRRIKDQKLEHDFNYTNYELELKRKNYERALFYLRDIYKQDSLSFKTNVASQLGLLDANHRQEARERENELIIQRQKYDRVKFWAVTSVAGLLLISVGLLVTNVKRKAKTNDQLTSLNAEVSRQKDNVDRINHHLEEIIDERTKDLQIKNKKLSEYSSYLSHQIRGPIATLKGLMNLEKEKLVDQQECIRMMNKCVGEIDNKILEMSDMLHDPTRESLEDLKVI